MIKSKWQWEWPQSFYRKIMWDKIVLRSNCTIEVFFQETSLQQKKLSENSSSSLVSKFGLNLITIEALVYHSLRAKLLDKDAIEN